MYKVVEPVSGGGGNGSLQLASDLDTEFWQPLPGLESVLNFKEGASSTLPYLIFGFKLLGNMLCSSVRGNWA